METEEPGREPSTVHIHMDTSEMDVTFQMETNALPKAEGEAEGTYYKHLLLFENNESAWTLASLGEGKWAPQITGLNRRHWAHKDLGHVKLLI